MPNPTIFSAVSLKVVSAWPEYCDQIAALHISTRLDTPITTASLSIPA
jgi:hypothetical protein